MLGLPYPGGPEISRLADMFLGTKKLELPRPMLHTKDYNFSFSGLKTAVLYYIRELQTKIPPPAKGEVPKAEGVSLEQKQEISCEFQNAVTDVLIKKTSKAIEEFGIQTLIIGGGVAANKHIIKSFQEKLEKDFPETELFAPARELTGDNALMIALAGYFKIKKSPDAIYNVDDIKAEGNLSL
jgi:N6-L-threonylcarbamoyladenine synthase